MLYASSQGNSSITSKMEVPAGCGKKEQAVVGCENGCSGW